MGCCDSAARARAFSSIDGTPTYYWRDGTRDRHTFYCSDGTYKRLVNWIRHLRYLSGKYGDATAYDTLTYLVLAGAYVCRNDGCVSLHNYGRAIDLDRVSWSNGLVSDPYFHHHASSYRRVRRRYLALDAVCRRYFRYVLDGYYNSAHTDHVHMDDSALPAVCRKESPATPSLFRSAVTISWVTRCSSMACGVELLTRPSRTLGGASGLTATRM